MPKSSHQNRQGSLDSGSSRLPVAVLGHKGFIGGAINHTLVEEGSVVWGASSQECDLLDARQVKGFLETLPDGARVVFCAAISRIVEDSYSAFLSNIQMVLNFVSAARAGRLGGVVYLSSVDVYGRTPELPITERTLPAPASFYGLSKLACEFLLRMPGALDCPLTVLRLPGVYGPGDRGRSVVGRFLTQMQRNGRITIYGDGSVRRDFVEVSDICRVVKYALESPLNGVLNLATGTSLSIREIVATLAKAAGFSPAIDYEPEDLNAAGDLVFDVTALRTSLPIRQFKSLQEGAAAYVASLARETSEIQSRTW